MYVRYLGTKVCYTLEDGRFYMGDREELTPEEKKVCDQGGGDMPVSESVNFLAR